MEWADFPWGAVVTLALALTGLIVLALTEVFRRQFASKESVCRPDGSTKFPRKEDVEKDLNEIGRKVERNLNLYVALDDRTGKMEGDFRVLEERQKQEWKLISDQIARTAETMKAVTAELKEVTKMQQDYALRFERHHRDEG